MKLSTHTGSKIQALIDEEGLPSSFSETVNRFLLPLCEALARCQREKHGTLVVGINGAQGTGKSTVTSFLCLILGEQYGLPTASFSLDDIYLTRAERQQLSRDIHPMLAVRGVPGTHDVELGVAIVRQLLSAGDNDLTAIPSFDKAQDDRRPRDQWPAFKGRPSVILVEGWCAGAAPEDEHCLCEPVNGLERDRDGDGSWRRYVNRQLKECYPRLFSLFDVLVMLAAPGWDAVYRWRLLQETKLGKKYERLGLDGKGVMTPSQVAGFVQYYERITRHCLAEMPGRADFLLEVDEDHRIISLQSRSPGHK